MKATRHAARRRPGRRGPWITTTAALAAIGVLVYLVMTLRAGDGADAVTATDTRAGADPGRAAAVTAGPRTGATPTAPQRTPSPAASPSSTPPSVTASATPSKPKPPKARASATVAARSDATQAPSAGRIRPGVTYRGLATHYDAADGDGACLFGPADDMMIAAMNHTDYETAKACGAYIAVRTANGASVTVRITNECPLPCAPGQIDLSRQAFAKLADLSKGELSITWSLLSPSTAEKISVRYKTGSSPYWCGIQVVGHRNPVARLEVAADGGWRALPRAEFNYFLSEQGAGCGKSLRITDIYGERLVLDGIAIRPDALQSTGVQFRQR
ncbi:expansin EXLX1 family cellulose-binding protein [Streptomyces sp. NPDC002328]|uniref:expansin EXLX1 family cellulose-binding protein n=1 Tax=Streptomyces sp. NPDC002328 TaxID=3364642 RepID=UPI0036818DCC